MIDFNIDNYLRISLTDVVLVCISTFLIVMFAKKFFWEKLLTLIQKRQDLIQENIDSSVAIKKQAEDVKEQYDEKLRNVSQEAHTILVSARAHADQEKQQIIKEAN
ncbi:MAG: ATP synthase F0 subunit B, partial [Holdemanella sp.]|nr:ATP synthase F0 subunit B [Holdemanella sp.]